MLSPARVMHYYYSSTYFEEQASLFLCFTRLSWVKSCLTMFFTANFTSPVFSLWFSPRPRLSWNFYLEDMRSKKPAKSKVVVACGFAFLQRLVFSCRCLQESVFFMPYCKKGQHQEHILIVLQGCKWQAAITICMQEATTKTGRTTSFYIILWGSKRWQRFVHIPREWAYIWKTKVNHGKVGRDSCEGMAMMAHHATIKYFICCRVQEATTMSIYYVISQEKQQKLYFWCCKADVLLGSVPQQ